MKIVKPLLVMAALVMAACAPSPAPGEGDAAGDSAPAMEPGGSVAPPAAAEQDSARLARLEREARALARADGCAEGGCRTAPVGSRPCGGPRSYLVYCAATTDSAALFARLAELARAEDEINQRSGAMSTCEYRMPPETEVVGGTCRARPAGASAQIPQ